MHLAGGKVDLAPSSRAPRRSLVAPGQTIMKSWMSTRRPAWAPPPKIWISGKGRDGQGVGRRRDERHSGWPAAAAAAACATASETAMRYRRLPPRRALSWGCHPARSDAVIDRRPGQAASRSFRPPARSRRSTAATAAVCTSYPPWADRRRHGDRGPRAVPVEAPAGRDGPPGRTPPARCTSVFDRGPPSRVPDTTAPNLQSISVLLLNPAHSQSLPASWCHLSRTARRCFDRLVCEQGARDIARTRCLVDVSAVRYSTGDLPSIAGRAAVPAAGAAARASRSGLRLPVDAMPGSGRSSASKHASQVVGRAGGTQMHLEEQVIEAERRGRKPDRRYQAHSASRNIGPSGPTRMFLGAHIAMHQGAAWCRRVDLDQPAQRLGA